MVKFFTITTRVRILSPYIEIFQSGAAFQNKLVDPNQPLTVYTHRAVDDARLSSRAKGGCWEMAHGTVKWFNDAKGYGFISRSEDGKDVFVHYSSIVGEGFRSLIQGQEVRYEIAEGPKGLYAAQVQPVAGEAQAAAAN